MSSPTFEHLLRILARHNGPDGVVQHVFVRTELHAYEDPAFASCAILSHEVTRDLAPTLTTHAFGALNACHDGARA